MTQTKQKQGGQCCVISRKVVSSHAATVFRTDNVVSFHAKLRHHTQRRSSLLRRLTWPTKGNVIVPANWRHWLEPRPGPKLPESFVYRFHRDLNSDRWIQSPECSPLHHGTQRHCFAYAFLKSSPLRQCVHVCVCSNSRKSVPAFLSILSHRSVGGVVASIAAFQAVDLGSIPGRRKGVSGGLEFIQGDLVTPLLDVISPKANPFPPGNDY